MLSILVISRSEQNLRNLLTSIGTSKNCGPVEVLIAWNAKSDPPFFRDVERQTSVHFYQIMPYNFAKNNNALAKYASGDYLLFLNDDIVLDQDCLSAAVQEIKKPEIGIVGANLRYADDQIQHAGILFDDTLKPYHRCKHEAHYLDQRVANDMFVPAVTGAFLLIRRNEFLTLQFDERFTVAGEDVALNLAYRERYKKGVLYCADATAVHHENVTRKETDERSTPAEDMALIKEYASKSVGDVSIVNVKRPKVRIITEKEGWIMHRKGLEIQRHFGEEYVRINQDWDADIHYYINYGYFNKRPKSGLVVGNYTHFDPELHADKFAESAFVMDHCTSVSELTSKKLLEIGVPSEKITTIRVGADSSFRPKLTLGVSGRVYKGGRKGSDILQTVLEDPFIRENCRIFATNPEWGLPLAKYDDLADFYRSIDYLLVTSRIEGGPVPVMEALACGTLSIAPPIGVVPEFPHVSCETGSADSLKATLRKLIEEVNIIRGEISRPMRRLNWAGWSVRHEKLFRRLASRVALS